MKSNQLFDMLPSHIPYVKEGLAIVALAVLFGGGYFGYTLYSGKAEQHAFTTLYEVMESYQEAEHKVLQLDTNKKDAELTPEQIWEDVQVLVDAGYTAHQRSYLAPFFLTYKAKIAQQTGQGHGHVYALISQATRLLSKKSPFAGLLQMECAKMLLDMNDDAKKKQGLDLLHSIARDPENSAYVEAWYLLGVQALFDNKTQQAIKNFELVTQACKEQKLFESSWLKLAQDKLDALV